MIQQVILYIIFDNINYTFIHVLCLLKLKLLHLGHISGHNAI